MKIGLVDYEIGNLGSVLRSFHLLGVDIERVRDPSESQNYSSLIPLALEPFLIVF